MIHHKQALPENSVEELLEQSRDPNDIIKRQALEQLNRLLPPLAAQRAGELLEDPEYIVRQAAVHILQSQENPRIHLKKIRPLLQDEHHVPRHAALEFLQKTAPDEAVSRALDLLDCSPMHTDFMLTTLAVTILAASKNGMANQILLRYSQNDNPLIRIHCIELLVQRRAEEAASLLRKALSDPDEYVRLRASFIPIPLPSVSESTEEEKKCRTDLTFKEILNNLSEQDPDFALSYAEAKLQDRDHTVRNIALEYVKEYSAKHFLSTADAGTEDSFYSTWNALKTVAAKRDTESRKILLKYAAHDDKRIRAQCLYLLAEYFPEDAQPLLEKALASSDTYTRICASSAIEFTQRQGCHREKKWKS